MAVLARSLGFTGLFACVIDAALLVTQRVLGGLGQAFPDGIDATDCRQIRSVRLIARGLLLWRGGRCRRGDRLNGV